MKASSKQHAGLSSLLTHYNPSKTDIFVIFIILYCNNLRRASTLSSRKRINMDKITEIKGEI
jgi:hypothetical protein